MLLDNPGIVPVDYTQMAGTATAGAQDLQRQAAQVGAGVVDPNRLANEREIMNQQLTGTMGNAVNDLMSRGVLGSSPTGQSFYNIGQGVNQALTANYNNDLNAQSASIEQQRGLLSMPMELQNAAQNASIDIPGKLLGLASGQQADTNNLWQAMAQQRIASKPDIAVQPSNGGLLSAVGSLGAAKIQTGSCLAKGTFVITETGERPIEDISVGDKVFADKYLGLWETVLEIAIPETKECFTIATNQRAVFATATQPFVTGTGSVVPADLDGQEVLTTEGMQNISVEPAGSMEVYYLKTTGTNSYYANSFLVRGLG